MALQLGSFGDQFAQAQAAQDDEYQSSQQDLLDAP